MTDAALAEAETGQPAPELRKDEQPMRLYLVDGSGYIFRAYHALPPLTRKSDGAPVGAVSGFCNMMWKLICELRGQPEAPTHLAVIFDATERTFRNDISVEYKANRPPAPDDLIPQFAMVREATRAFGVPAVELEGYEADDLIATYARQATERGGEVVIISSDKDLMQLVNDNVSMLDTMKNLKIGREQVIEKFGVPPEKVIDVQALCGDSVDNVPGAPGIGIKTAAQLIGEYGDLDTLLARAGEIKQPKRRETLINFADQVRMSRALVTLDADAPVDDTLDSFEVKAPDNATLIRYLEEMEFRNLARRVGQPAGAAASAAVPGPPPPPDPVAMDAEKYQCVRSVDALDAWITRCTAAGRLALHVECEGSDIAGLSIAVGPGEAAYIPFDHRGPDGLELGAASSDQLEEAAALARLKPLLEDVSVLKVGLNIKASLKPLARRGIALAPYDDVQLISYVLAAGLHAHDKDELSRTHLGHDPMAFKALVGVGQKQVRVRQAPLDRAIVYGAEMADIIVRLHDLLKPRLAREGLLTVYETLERPLPPVLADIEVAGIRVAPHVLRELSQRFAARIAEQEAEAHRLAGHPFNLGSPKQIGDVLFGEMGLPGGRKTATGAWSTDASTLEELGEQGHPLPLAILEHRQLTKLKNTYTDALVAVMDPETCRVHTTYLQTQASTGRLSSTDPNLQNIPIRTEIGREIRAAFVAKPGHVLVSADYSQIELRLLAHIGDIPQLKRAFAENLDIHALTASEMFGVPVEGMPKEVRSRAKAINFGIIYGISAFGLSNQLGIDQSEAGAYIKTYFERFPGIRDYMDRQKKIVREQGFVTTLFGRRIHVPDIRAKSFGQRQFAERVSINAPIQGSAADIIRRAMIRVPAALKKEGLEARMLLSVHDELIFEAPEAEADAVCAVARRVMERAAEPAVALTVPLGVDARAGPTWDEAH
jgi:DNA polymerase-1